MTLDPTSRPARGKIGGWLSSLMGGRSSGGRITPVSGLPPRVLNDIGLQQDVIDALLRHRR